MPQPFTTSRSAPMAHVWPQPVKTARSEFGRWKKSPSKTSRPRRAAVVGHEAMELARQERAKLLECAYQTFSQLIEEAGTDQSRRRNAFGHRAEVLRRSRLWPTAASSVFRCCESGMQTTEYTEHTEMQRSENLEPCGLRIRTPGFADHSTSVCPWLPSLPPAFRR